MPEYRTDRAHPERGARRTRLRIPAGLFAVLVVAVLASAGVGARYCARGDFGVIHAVLSLFFSINLLICYWEACLFLRRDYIEARAEYWRERRCERAVRRPPNSSSRKSACEDVVADAVGGRLGDVRTVR